MKSWFGVILLFGFSVLWGQSEIKWLTFEEAIEKHKTKPKKLLVDVYTDWCGWCKKMDRDTYDKPRIVEYISENYYPIKLNAEQKGDIQFDGKVFKYRASGRRGVHEMALALTNSKLSYPTTVFLDEQLRMIQPLAGYIKEKEMYTILTFIGDDHFKTTDWEEYRKSFTP